MSEGTWLEVASGYRTSVAAGEAIYRTTLQSIEYKDVAALFPTGGTVTVKYLAQQSANVVHEAIVVGNLQVDLTDQYAEKLVTGSARFNIGGKTYVDRDGQLYCDIDPATGSGTLAGDITYSSGNASLKVFPAGGANGITVQSLLTEQGNDPCDYLIFRIPTSPVRSGSFQLRGTFTTGETFNVTADTNGIISGTDVYGHIVYETGLVEIRFGGYTNAEGLTQADYYHVSQVRDGNIFVPSPVWIDTLRYNAVSYSYLPLDSEILGLDPVRLPPDGKVPIFRVGDVVVVHHTGKKAFPNNPAPGYSMSVGRERCAFIKVVDSLGTALSKSLYSADCDAGTVKLADNFVLGSLVQPLYALNRIEDMVLVKDVQINGTLTFTRPLTHAFPKDETRVSSAIIIGDMQAAVDTTVFFSQKATSSVWSDVVQGETPTAQYNRALSPVIVSNMGSIKERWSLNITSVSNGIAYFSVVGESVGQIATGNSNTACAPTNPATGAPYFQINPEGWGTGWAAGNCLRFNTVAANYPLWIARTVLQGPATVFDANGDGVDDADGFYLEIRGDIDNP